MDEARLQEIEAQADGSCSGDDRETMTALVAEVRRLTAALAMVTTERDRLQRACDEGLPREYIACPKCGEQHIEGARFDKPEIAVLLR